MVQNEYGMAQAQASINVLLINDGIQTQPGIPRKNVFQQAVGWLMGFQAQWVLQPLSFCDAPNAKTKRVVHFSVCGS
jgi:hypothetical protein